MQDNTLDPLTGLPTKVLDAYQKNTGQKDISDHRYSIDEPATPGAREENAFQKYDSENLDSYTSRSISPKFGLDNEDLRAQRQDISDKWANGIVKAVGVAGTSATESTAGLLYGLGAAIGTIGSDKSAINALYDNDFSRTLDSFNKQLAEAMPNYYRTNEENRSLLGSLGTANFWSDKFLNGAGYAVGAMVTGMGLAKFGALSKLVGSGKLVGLSEEAIKADAALTKLAANVKFANRADFAKNAILMSTGESAAEARQAKDEVKNRLLKDLKLSKGDDYIPTKEEYDQIESLSDAAGNLNYGLNLVITGGSNALQFKKMLGPGFNANKIELNAIKNVEGKAVAEIETVGKARLNKVLEGIAEEGGQEGLQSSTQTMMSDYYGRRFDKNNPNHDLFESAIEGLSTTLGSKDGWESILLGALLGGPMGLRGVAKETNQKNINTQKVANLINNSELLGKLSNSVENATRIASFQKEKDEALKAGDIVRYKNLEFQERKSYIKSVLDAGGIDQLVDKLESSKGMSVEEFKKTFGYAEDYKFNKQSLNPDTQADINEHIEDIKKQILNVKNTYDKIETAFPLTSNKKEDVIIHKALKESLWDKATSIDNIDDRIKKIKTNLSYITRNIIFDPYNQNDIDNITNPLIKKEVLENINDINKLTKQKEEYIQSYNDLVENGKKKIEKELKDKAKKEKETSKKTNEETEEQSQDMSDLFRLGDETAEPFTATDEEDTTQKDRVHAESLMQIEDLKRKAVKQKELEELLNNEKNLEDLDENSRVKYAGMEGRISKHPEENVYIFTDEATGKQYDIPMNEQLGYAGKTYEYGIFELPKENPITDFIDIEGDKITINGKTYINGYSNPLMAINKDKEGNIISVTLSTENGKPRTFKKYADELAYAILLQVYNNLENESKKTREQTESRISGEATEADIEREKQPISERDSEESKKIEEAIANLEKSIAEARELYSKNSVEREQAELFEAAMESKTSKELLEYYGLFKGHKYTKQLNEKYKELVKAENELLKEGNTSTDYDNAEEDYDPSEPKWGIGNLGLISKYIYRTTAGTDNGVKTPEGRYFRYIQDNNLTGNKLLIVTKNNNPTLYAELLAEDKTAADYEAKNKGYQGIFSIIVDANNEPVLSDGKKVFSTILKDTNITLNATKEDQDNLNAFRDKLLKETKDIYLTITGVTQGVSQAAINKKNKEFIGEVQGRLTTDDTRENLLELPTISPDGKTTTLRNGQHALVGRLYAFDDEGTAWALDAKPLDQFQVKTAIRLLLELAGIEQQTSLNPLEDLKKIINLVNKNQNNKFKFAIKGKNITFGNITIAFEYLKDPAYLIKLQTFLELKFNNANNKYAKNNFQDRFEEPIFNEATKTIEYKQWNTYQSYLMSKFGTYLPILGNPKFVNSYVTFEPSIQTNNITLVDEKPVIDTNPISTELPTNDLTSKRKEVRSAIAKAGQGEGGNFFVTLTDGTKEGAVRISFTGDELAIGKKGDFIDIALINKIENPDGSIIYNSNNNSLEQQPTSSNQSDIKAKKADIERRRQELGLQTVKGLFEPSQGSNYFRIILKGDKFDVLAFFDGGQWSIFPKQPNGEFQASDPKTGNALILNPKQRKEVVEKYAPKELIDLLEAADRVKGIAEQDKFMEGRIKTYLDLYEEEILRYNLDQAEQSLAIYESPNYPNKDSQDRIVKAQKKEIAEIKSKLAKYDAELKALKQQPKASRYKKSGKKLARTANIRESRKLTQDEIDWFTERFPNIPVEWVKGLVESQDFAQFVDSAKVLLSDKAVKNTLRHEAFHVVTQLYLTKKELSAIYTEAREKLGDNSLTDLEVEEILAEDFANYKETGKILAGRPSRNTLFRKLINLLKSIVGLKSTDIRSIYNKLETGYYTNSKLVNNRQFLKLSKAFEGRTEAFTKEVLDGIDGELMQIMFGSSQGFTPQKLLELSQLNEIILDQIKDGYIDTLETIESKNQLNETDLKNINDLEYILDNWETEVVPKWQERMSSLGISLSIEKSTKNEEDKVPISEDSNIEPESVHEDETKSDRSGEAFTEANTINPKDVMFKQTKMLIRTLPRVDANGNIIKNRFGKPVLVDFNRTYTFLLRNLAGISEYEDQYVKIKELAARKPEFNILLDRIKSPGTTLSLEQMMFQNQFRQDFDKNYSASYTTIIYPNGNYVIQDNTKESISGKIKERWINNLKDPNRKSLYLDEKGKIKVKTNLLEETNPLVFLNAIGIDFSENTIPVIKDSNIVSNAVNAIKIYLKEKDLDITELYNSKQKTSESVYTRINDLLDFDASYTNDVVELSFNSTTGKTVYAMSLNTNLSIVKNIINNAKSLDDLFAKLPNLNSVYTKNSYWLTQLFNQDGSRNKNVKINLDLLDGIKSEDESNKAAIQTAKLSEGDRLVQELNNLLIKGKTAYIRAADAATEHALSLNNHGQGNHLAISLDEVKKNGVNSIQFRKIIKGYFKDELNRIAEFTLNGLGKDIDKYNKAAQKFAVFQGFDGMANIKTQVEERLEVIKTLKKEDQQEAIDKLYTDLIPALNEATKLFFTKYTKELVNRYTKFGINNETGLDASLKEEDFTTLMTTVAINDFINTVEQIKLFVGDMAFYTDLFKRTKGLTGTKETSRVGKTMDDWLNLNHIRRDGKKADSKINVAIFRDSKQKSDYLDSYTEALIKSGLNKEQSETILEAYTKMDEGDAQGWITLDEYKEFFIRTGKWTNQHEAIHEKALNGETLTPDELFYYMTLKAQYFGPQEYEGLNVPTYHKFSLMPLIPSMIKGTNLEAFNERLMNNKDKDGNNKAVGYALFESGSKVGTKVNKDTGKANDFYTNTTHGEIDSKDLVTESVYYRFLGIQVEIEPKVKEEVTFGTQFRKLLFSNLFANGKSTKFGTLFNEYNSIFEELVTTAKNKLLAELHIDGTTFENTDVEKLVSIIQQEAKDRTLPDNIIDALQKDVITGKLMYKFDTLVNKAKIDALISNLVNARLIKQMTNGDAYIQGASSGFENKGERKIGSNDILKFYTQEGENGKTTHAECMIPLTDNFQYLIDRYGSLEAVNKALEGYHNGEDTGIKEEWISLVGYRIPTQGMNSIDFFKIKKFLPPVSSNLIILPTEIVAKSGGDYDIDKMNIFRPHLQPKTRTQHLQNRIIQIALEVLQHPDNFTALITPNSTKILTDLVKEIRFIKWKNKTENKDKQTNANKVAEDLAKNLKNNIQYTNQLKLTEKVKQFSAFLAGKAGVGIAALHNTHHIISQICNLHLANEYKVNVGTAFEQTKKVKINLNYNKTKDGLINLADQKDAKGENNISEVISQIINAVVDIAKDPFIVDLNMNLETLSTYLYLVRIGVPFEDVAYFMSQPIISDFLEQKAINKSVFMKASGNNKSTIAIKNELILKYLSKAKVEYTRRPGKANSAPTIDTKHFKGIKSLTELKTKFRELALINHPDKGGDVEIMKEINNEYELFRKFPTLLSTNLEEIQKEIIAIGDENDNFENNYKDRLKSNLEIDNQESMQFALDQLDILSDYLEYKEQAGLLSEAMQSTNHDTAGIGSNLEASWNKLALKQKVDETGFIKNLDKVYKETFIGKFDQHQFHIDAFSQFYETQQKDIVDNTNFLVRIINPSIEANKNKLKTLITNDFINYVVQNYGFDNISEKIDKLFKGDDSVAKQILKLRNKEEKSETEKEIVNNLLVKELFPLIDKPVNGNDGLKIFSKRMDTFTYNSLVQSFRELKDLAPELYDNIAELGILQSGLNNSPVTYFGLIPFETNGDLVNKAFENFYKKNGVEELYKFNQLFIRNNYKDPIISNFAKRNDLATYSKHSFNNGQQIDLKIDNGLGNGMYGKLYDRELYNPKLTEFKQNKDVVLETIEQPINKEIKPNEVTKFFETKFNLPVEYDNTLSPNIGGYVKNGKVYLNSNINPNNLEEVLIEEYTHVITTKLEKEHPEVFEALFNDLINTPEYKEIRDKAIAKVNSLYPELTTQEVETLLNKGLEQQNQVNYSLKAVNILQSDKAKQVFDKGKKNNWDLDRILTELQVPKEQKQIILDKNIKVESESRIIEEEGMLLNRFPASNYFKKIPSDFNEISTIKDSVKEINISDIEVSEIFNEDKLKKLGEYKVPEYGQYDTHFPVAITFNNKIILLDGHHRLEAAKRKGIKKIKVAIKDVNNNYKTNLREEIITSLLADNSYTIEINTAKQNHTDEGIDSTEHNTLIVPGGTNYKINVFKTLLIIPSIINHFFHKNQIGWFRSDEVLPKAKEFEGKDVEDYKKQLEDDGITGWEQDMFVRAKFGTAKNSKFKTRRILEVQDDWLQKLKLNFRINDINYSKGTLSERDGKYYLQYYELNKKERRQDSNSRSLTKQEYDKFKEKSKNNTVWLKGEVNNEVAVSTNEYFKAYDEFIDKGDILAEGYTEQQRQFAKLLANEEYGWTFRIKAIIQDSAKKGYEKVLFPSGNTASKIEGHTTLEEFKKQKEDRIKELEDGKELFVDQMTKDQIKATNNEINQLKQELKRVETEGFGALRPIFNFYENTVTNILKKQGYNPTLITDEYGNTWNELTLTEKQRQELILLSKLTGEIDNSKTQLPTKITQSFKHEVLGQATAMATRGKVSSGLAKIANDILKWIKETLSKIGFKNVNTIKTFKDLKQVFEDNNVKIDLNQPTEIKSKIDSSKKIENLKRGDIINFQQQEFLVERVKNEGIDVRDVNTGDVDFISTEDYINETQEQPINKEIKPKINNSWQEYQNVLKENNITSELTEEEFNNLTEQEKLEVIFQAKNCF